MAQKRVLAIHDVSCFGRCSLTVALPIISAAGAECTVLPTAVLSTHTGGFTGFTYRDLTGDLKPTVEHWKDLGLSFDCIYTGFLGSFEQIDIVMDIIDALRGRDTKVVVDPVMADNGELYKVFSDDFPEGMRKLCGSADLILPNITEASLLAGTEYSEGPHSVEFTEDALKRLSGICRGNVILTGVNFDGGALNSALESQRRVYVGAESASGNYLGAAAYDAGTKETSYALRPRIPGFYHGTGDVFGSAVVASLANGKSLRKAAEIAVDYTSESIQRTRDAGTDVRFGVNFEAGLRKFSEDVI
ncbi:MAG: bifunctional hydroxymethylpyrimidine kinase/phosphomethylpyrimidine kinase [Candidatus Methanoplasma sp.]|jgi:pyridoxine kinase|nr:bifunctional hydroxymethylpyrimidine kinase/phosphomethylpyrimidine kinase [Candidatus Methanoplasma sp.]